SARADARIAVTVWAESSENAILTARPSRRLLGSGGTAQPGATLCSSPGARLFRLHERTGYHLLQLSRAVQPMPGSPSSRRRRRAIIVGGSMSGLFAAAFLRQIGWDADVYERSTVELVGRGAGITTHPELLEALEKSGAGLSDLGIEVEKRITLDRAGRVIAEKVLPQILTSWDRLQRLLRGPSVPGPIHPAPRS